MNNSEQLAACTTYSEARDLVMSWAPQASKESRACVVGAGTVNLEMVTMMGKLNGRDVHCIWLMWPKMGRLELWLDGLSCHFSRTFIPDPPTMMDQDNPKEVTNE